MYCTRQMRVGIQEGDPVFGSSNTPHLLHSSYFSSKSKWSLPADLSPSCVFPVFHLRECVPAAAVSEPAVPFSCFLVSSFRILQYGALANLSHRVCDPEDIAAKACVSFYCSFGFKWNEDRDFHSVFHLAVSIPTTVPSYILWDTAN